MSVQDYLVSACTGRALDWSELIVYDQSAPGITAIPNDSFLHVLLDKLSALYKHVHLLVGQYSTLC